MALHTRSRPSRNAATRASAKISAVAKGEVKPEPKIPAGDLLGEALAPIRDDEQDEWKAWVEIESEPAFFNGLLRDLGVEDVKVTEMFSISIDELDLLPKPVLGFVFLCRYVGENSEETPGPPKELWFANQTMANGCATVALLNILMNSQGVELGEQLNDFKATTKDLSPFVRGYLLDTNKDMLKQHNAFARRIELLNSDLLLSNEWDECAGVPEDDTAPPKGGRGGNRKSNPRTGRHQSRKKQRSEDACHYKAFVPLAGQVWILDGLEKNPVSLGAASEETWIPLALEGIQSKMAEAGDMVNILAVCQSPAVALRKELASNVRTLTALREALHDDSQPDKGDGRIYIDEDTDSTLLDKYGLTWDQLDTANPDQAVLDSNTTIAEKREAIQTLETEQARIQSEYLQEMHTISLDEERSMRRKKDHTSAVHKWISKLSERGVLERVVSESNPTDH